MAQANKWAVDYGFKQWIFGSDAGCVKSAAQLQRSGDDLENQVR